MADGLSRGDVHRIRLPCRRGHEQSGARYGVVVQADELLALSTVIVAPTSQSAMSTAFRPPALVDGMVTRILVDQLQVIDVERLGTKTGRLDPAERLALDDALEVVLGLR